MMKERESTSHNDIASTGRQIIYSADNGACYLSLCITLLFDGDVQDCLPRRTGSEFSFHYYCVACDNDVCSFHSGKACGDADVDIADKALWQCLSRRRIQLP